MLTRRRGSFRRDAFTLVELLVVVAVIAALAGMLRPALRSARDQAKRVTCAAHQRQVSIATEAYAVDFGTLPIMNRQGHDINYRRINGQFVRLDLRGFGPETWPEYLHEKNFWTGAPFRGLIFQVDIHPGMSATDFGAWRNFGLLWANRAFGDPRGLFCPSQREPFFAWDNPYNPWPPRLETARRPDRPQLANHTASSFERRLGLTGIPWDRIRPRTVLTMDRLLNPEQATEIVSSTHRDGVNVVYRDGQVRYLRDRRLREWLPREEDGEADFWSHREDLLALYVWMDEQGGR